MEIIIFWLILSTVVAIIGSSRRVGFGGALFASVFLSPLIGLIIVLCSRRNSDVEFQNKLLTNTKEKYSNPASEIDKLFELRSEGKLTESEYQTMKQKIIDSM